MSVIKCKMCGGDLELIEGSSVAVCEYCGSQQTVPAADNEKKLTLFARANRLRLACEFDKAAGVYESIVADFPTEAEAYWGLVLCRYGIEYVDDPATGKKIPTCHRSSFDSVMEDSDFEQALENADAVARRVYRDEAKAIEELRRGIVEVSGKEPPYDIFICYKETAEDGQRTVDSVIAQDVYDALTEKGYRVFFSRISLEDKLGTEYEPYIFAALHSAKIMLAFGTDYEYYNAVWVKNEWSRYLQLMTKDKSKHLIPCYKGIDADDMPKEFAKLQAQDMGKVGAMQDLLRAVDKIMGRDKAAPAPTVTSTVAASATVESLLKRIEMFLEDGDWDSADEYCEKVLDITPENAQAYLYKLMVELEVHHIDELQEYEFPFDERDNYHKVMRFGDERLKAQLTAAIEHINARLENARKDAIYAEAQSKMDGGDASTYSEAIALFQSIPEWKDAEAQISICQKKIEEIETKEESNRLEAERKEGERKIAAEKAAKKRKKIVIIAAPIVSVCAIIAIVVTTVIIPSNKYKQGLELLKQQKYDEAYAVFSSLNYKDSEEKMTLAEEMQQLEAGQFDEALEILDSLRDTENIDEILTEYFDKNSENLFNKKQYAGFVALCERTGTHPKNYEEAYYQVGILKMGSGDLTDACNAFSTVRGYKKADEYYNLCTFYDKYDGLWGLDGVFTTIYGTGWDYTTPGEVETMYWNFSPYEGQEPARFYIAPNGVVTADLWGVYDIGSRACSVNGTTVKATDTFSSDGKNYYREFSFDLETKTSHSVTYNADGSMHQTKDAHYALKG